MASDDTEITLGVGKLLGLFFLLAAICGVFFSIGYSLGKSSGREQALNDQAAQVGATESSSTTSGSNDNKPPAGVAGKPEAQSSSEESNSNNQPGLTFYKAVQQNGTGAQAATDEIKPSTTGTAPKTELASASPAASTPA